MTNVENLNRLIGRGLPTTVAMDVDAGRLDEEFEVALWTTRREAERWAKDAANRSAAFTPVWDFDPARFYLAFDGERPDTVDGAALTVIEVTVGELHGALQHGSGRDKDPWSIRYWEKTAVIAYRWARGLAVTPPLIRPLNGEVVIAGGMHRFHLARHYGAQTMPVLLRREELAEVVRVLPSARAL
ncbi:hypothetical protein [Polymorphum gilvum]|uniref:Predicted transcriptional regulator n=1 Tax=Polymorphum gilvum (strain LMG 25793 / CGMCC 1.9160 / SL003B-26A1) TaxID=991905 RepID=F2J3V5_POLGS|nr:hypothetical protein [Polymorphum gilvum]ADZ68937.1 Predicted transcriptional regulator [Polymorphum gilvum SL003B-26A1]